MSSPNSATDTNSNSMRRRLQRMLEKPPSETTRMVAHVVNDPPIPMGEWRRDELVPGLVDILLERMHDQHEDSGAAQTNFVFTFLGPDDRCLLPRKFELRSRAMPNDDPTMSMVSQLDGSERASAALAQSVALAMARMFMAGQQAQTGSLVGLLDKLSERLTRADERADELRDQRDELTEVLTQVQNAKEAAEKEPEVTMTEAQRKVLELAERGLALAIMKYSQPS